MTREHILIAAMAVSAVCLLSSEAGPAHAQAFTNVKSALVDYSQSEVEPARWNRRFYMIGNGGHAGEGPDDPGRASQRASALQLGFVIATTNTGHDARMEAQGRGQRG
jgi:tannase/feruloyl esterase